MVEPYRLVIDRPILSLVYIASYLILLVYYVIVTVESVSYIRKYTAPVIEALTLE